MRGFFCIFCILMKIKFLGATDQPIVGVLTLEPDAIQKFYPDLHIGSYISAAYVKFLESAGARVVPVWIGQDEQYYEKIVKYTNGILFPGGATSFRKSKGYAQSAKTIFNIAQKVNDLGVYYPIIGICLGMEVLSFASTGGRDIRVPCRAMKVSFPLDFIPDNKISRIFKDIPDDLLSVMKTNNVTYNNHEYCLTDEVLAANNLTDVWRVLTKNEDIDGISFISTMEHTKYPFYGFQFHPEKIKFEFRDESRIPHDIPSGRVSQYFADFAVEECRKNTNSFPNEDFEHESLIYNFSPVFGSLNCTYSQMYLFTHDEPMNYNKLLFPTG